MDNYLNIGVYLWCVSQCNTVGAGLLRAAAAELGTASVRCCRQVAEELVSEYTETSRCDSPTEQLSDQKNIRRRVYDALNVLMAMNIISKEKKEIRWLGLPTNSLQVRRDGAVCSFIGPSPSWSIRSLFVLSKRCHTSPDTLCSPGLMGVVHRV